MKTSGTFKINKQTKRYMALGKFKDEHDRGHFKRMMIEAQVAAEQAKHMKIDKSLKD